MSSLPRPDADYYSLTNSTLPTLVINVLSATDYSISPYMR